MTDRPERQETDMALATEHRPPTLHPALHDLETPPGFMPAEFIGGRIVMSPVPRSGHTMIIELVLDQLRPRVPDGTRAVQVVRIDCPATDDQPVPDISVVPVPMIRADVLLFPSDVTEFVCEVTSPSSVRYDVEEKRLIYARNNIPFYLLVDRKRSAVTLFSDPRNGDYAGIRRVSYGTDLFVPEPFDLKLDTGDFPVFSTS